MRTTIEDKLLANLHNVPLVIGLRQQGHMLTVEQMLRDGKAWDEIGEAIGWHGPTVRDWWAREVVAVLAELRQEKDDATVCGVVTGGWVENGMPFADVCENVRPCAEHPPEAWLTERNRADGAEEALADLRAELEQQKLLTLSALELHENTGETLDVTRAEFTERVERLTAELARARAVLGPDCPKCGRYLKAEHSRERVFTDPGNSSALADGFRSYHKPGTCRITISDLLANHPEIAKEMGLT